MPEPLNGASRVVFIVGDPIAQVKSPAGLSAAFHAHGHNTYVMPAHVAPAALATWLAGVSLAHNVDGIIVTVPHKFAARALCASTSQRADFLGAVNTLRRNPDGTWHGDMFDGLAFVAAAREQGCVPEGRSALLVGAGGAGSAIAQALVMAGVSQLAIHDADTPRRSALVERLASLKRCPISHGPTLHGSADPSGFDLVVNATPMGMKETDAYPLAVQRLSAHQFVGCVITAPAITPLIAAARAAGCATVTGSQMFARVRDDMLAFLVASDAAS